MVKSFKILTLKIVTWHVSFPLSSWRRMWSVHRHLYSNPVAWHKPNIKVYKIQIKNNHNHEKQQQHVWNKIPFSPRKRKRSMGYPLLLHTNLQAQSRGFNDSAGILRKSIYTTNNAITTKPFLNKFLNYKQNDFRANVATPFSVNSSAQIPDRELNFSWGLTQPSCRPAE